MGILQLLKEKEQMKKNYALIQQYEFEAENIKFDKYFKDKLEELYKNIKPPKAVVVHPPSPHKESQIRVRPEPKPEITRIRNKENPPVQHQIEQVVTTTPTTCISIQEPPEKKRQPKPRDRRVSFVLILDTWKTRENNRTA
jgi:hypothetical protein